MIYPKLISDFIWITSATSFDEPVHYLDNLILRIISQTAHLPCSAIITDILSIFIINHLLSHKTDNAQREVTRLCDTFSVCISCCFS